MTNIVVLIKQVPDYESERKLNDGDFTLDREAADAVLDEINGLGQHQFDSFVLANANARPRRVDPAAPDAPPAFDGFDHMQSIFPV